MKLSQNNQQSPPTGRLRLSKRNSSRGMTLLEMTVVILVLLTLISVLFVGARAWKRGSDRAICIMHIAQVQKGVRSFSNLYGYDPGATVPGLQTQIIGLGRFVEATPTCPAGGTYEFGGGTDLIPPQGQAYMTCSLAISDEHEPEVTPDW